MHDASHPSQQVPIYQQERRPHTDRPIPKYTFMPASQEATGLSHAFAGKPPTLRNARVHAAGLTFMTKKTSPPPFPAFLFGARPSASPLPRPPARTRAGREPDGSRTGVSPAFRSSGARNIGSVPPKRRLFRARMPPFSPPCRPAPGGRRKSAPRARASGTTPEMSRKKPRLCAICTRSANG